MIPGNLANEYKENGKIFVDLEECGDFLLPLYILGVVMDGKYIYSIGNTSGNKNEMDVHRFDLSTKKWELLYKSLREGIAVETRYQHEVVFYKRKIYIFAGQGDGDHPAVAWNIFYDFSVSVKYFIYIFLNMVPIFNKYTFYSILFIIL